MTFNKIYNRVAKNILNFLQLNTESQINMPMRPIKYGYTVDEFKCGIKRMNRGVRGAGIKLSKNKTIKR